MFSFALISKTAEAVRQVSCQTETSNTPELPNIVQIVSSLLHNSGIAHFLEYYQNLFFSIIVIIFLGILFAKASGKAKLVPGKLQNFLEIPIEWLHDLVIGVLGKRGEKYLPFVGTIFIYILGMNLLGLVPTMKSPTSSLNTTLALALTVFIYVQYTGIRNLGLLGYLDHLAGEPRGAVGFAMIPLMLPLHIMGELVRPVSLSLRLFGNILGEDSLIGALASLGVVALSFLHFPYVGIPFQLPFVILAILFSTIQALVFTLLSTIYISLMLPHEEH
ncbi:MAG TPA: F0F1 ATP synthase subunit A [candidate division Zixibacteria bacterium]